MKTKHKDPVTGSRTARQFAREKRMRKSESLLPVIIEQCAAFKIEFRQFNAGRHWQFFRKGVVMNYYPSTRVYMLQGKACPSLQGYINENAGSNDFIIFALGVLGDLI